MSKLRVQSFAVSIDGYGAGPNQNLQNPLGVRGPELMEWFFPTRLWRKMQDLGEGETGTDNAVAEQGFANIGAWILGRNMFGPVRGPWPDDSWRGWWGEEPPYHTPVFVLTHYPRAPLKMKGGTEFRFVTDGIHAALEEARAAAGGRVEQLQPHAHHRRLHLAVRRHVADPRQDALALGADDVVVEEERRVRVRRFLRHRDAVRDTHRRLDHEPVDRRALLLRLLDAVLVDRQR